MEHPFRYYFTTPAHKKSDRLDSLRGSGLGTKILQAFENEARERGCGSAVLYTINFQAPGFYEKNGWVRFGEVSSDREGISRIFMSKKL